MKQIKTTYLLIAMLLGTLAACTTTDDDSTTTLYDDAAIATFKLGTMNRYVDGVKSTYSGSSYAFHIDQLSRTIYNTDSLPVGTDVEHVVCTLGTVNNSMPFIIDLDGEYMTYYTGTDSIDFTTPRKFRVYSSNDSGYTEYTVKVNVHKEDPDAFVWKKMADIPAMTGVRTVVYDNRIYVFGDEGGTTKAYYTTDGDLWTAATLPALTDADAWQSVAATQDSLYILDGSKIYRSHDATTWDEDNSLSANGITLQRLLGASNTEVYGLTTDGTLTTKYCTDELPIWIKATDETQSSFDELPTQDYAMVSFPMNLSDSTDYVLMTGNKKIGEEWNSRMWRRIVDYSETGIISLLIEYITELAQGQSDNPEWIRKWTYLDRASDRRYEMPALENIQLLWYDDVILAFGGKDLNDPTVLPLGTIYKSRDNGITWKKDDNYTMPPADGEATFNNAATSFSATTSNGYIWITCAGTGEVWRGHLNRVAWGE